MTKTVREWIEFLNMGNNHYIGLQKQDGLKCALDNYHRAGECEKEFEGYLNEIVIKTYVVNFKKDGNYYHLLVY